jgi:hypothetical protein
MKPHPTTSLLLLGLLLVALPAAAEIGSIAEDAVAVSTSARVADGLAADRAALRERRGQ